MNTAKIRNFFLFLRYFFFARAEDQVERDRQRAEELERVIAVTHDLEKRGPKGFGRINGSR